MRTSSDSMPRRSVQRRPVTWARWLAAGSRQSRFYELFAFLKLDDCFQCLGGERVAPAEPEIVHQPFETSGEIGSGKTAPARETWRHRAFAESQRE